MYKYKITRIFKDGSLFFLLFKDVGWFLRSIAKNIKPIITISNTGDKWSYKVETSFKTTELEFTEGVAFVEGILKHVLNMNFK